MGIIATEEIPIRIVSSANLREFWAVKHKREKQQKMQIFVAVNQLLDKITLPVEIIFVRIAPRELDIDNLLYSLKGHRDYVSSLLIPGLKPGRADGDPNLSFKYIQVKGKAKQYALQIIFKTKEEKHEFKSPDLY